MTEALLHKPAPVHEDDPIGNLAGELHLVRDDQHGLAPLGDAAMWNTVLSDASPPVRSNAMEALVEAGLQTSRWSPS